MNKLLNVKNLIKDYTNKAENLNIIKDLNLSINYNEKISITGESGSGKTTLLNLLGGLDSVTNGEILIEGKDITKMDEEELAYYRNKKIGFIFQSHYLIEELNAIENVTIPFLINNFNIKASTEKALYLLSLLGMENKIKSHPAELSGGEKQRIAIARAFINDPLLILADEPTGNLDEKNSLKVMELLLDLTSKEKRALIIVTHSNQIVNLVGKNYHLSSGSLT